MYLFEKLNVKNTEVYLLQSVTLKGGTQEYFLWTIARITCRTTMPHFNVAVCAGRVIRNAT